MQIRDIEPDEHAALGRLMVDVYSRLEGFPGPAEQPRYYEMLANIGAFATRRGARVLVALSPTGELWGGVVYFADMSEYGSAGAAPLEKNASAAALSKHDPLRFVVKSHFPRLNQPAGSRGALSIPRDDDTNRIVLLALGFMNCRCP